MKKITAACLTALFCLVLFCSAASASNWVPDMQIDVALCADGSARITQIWSAYTEEGTEFYLACRDNAYLTITDLSVADENGAYTFVDGWDTAASFEEKANKCGIVETDEGVELCWGISEYGENQYTIEYTLHGLVGSYSDADGFNHRFVDEMNFFPTDVRLSIHRLDGAPLSDESCDIWAFGYDGQVVFENGGIYAWSESPLQSGQHMTILLALEKGLLSPTRTAEGSMEDVKARAFESSDYEDDLTFGDILIVLAVMLGIAVVLVVLALLAAALRRAKVNRRMKQAPYFRDLPNGGDLNVTHRLGVACELCSDDTLLGAYLLRLISQGCLECEGAPDGRGTVCLRLSHAPQSGNVYDDALYTILEAASDADGVLQPQELERFCDRNDTPLIRFMDSCRRSSLQTLIQSGCVKGAALENINSLTENGRRQLDELLGLKRFLLDFSLIQERGVRETIIWQDYMVYALLLGIADQLAPQIRKLYPEAIPQLEQYQRYIYSANYCNGLMYAAYRRQLQQLEAARSGGSGGYASFGGGGGFSGGGGGGVR